MRCPSCGAVCKKRSMKCAECGAFRNRTWVDTEAVVGKPTDSIVQQASAPQTRRSSIPKLSKSLIEFPTPGRQPIPQWRKELGERVREIQEKRAREASLENGEVIAHTEGDLPKTGKPLELLSKPSLPPTNPLVAAALRRIERAHASQYSGNSAVATAAAYEEQPAYDMAPFQAPEAISSVEELASSELPAETEAAPEKLHHLSVVANPLVVPAEEYPASGEVEGEPFAIQEPVVAKEEAVVAVKPKRLIRDNDPALNYLDSVPTTVRMECNEVRSAPVYARVFSAVLDFVVAAVLAVPVVALVKLTELQWRDPRVIGFASGTFIVAAFLYFTVSTALTGRTFAMRLFSIRVVDARTGLIPTGTQAAGRAFIYLLSIATAGLGLMFSFLDRERRTIHDRFTRTAVVRV